MAGATMCEHSTSANIDPGIAENGWTIDYLWSSGKWSNFYSSDGGFCSRTSQQPEQETLCSQAFTTRHMVAGEPMGHLSCTDLCELVACCLIQWWELVCGSFHSGIAQDHTGANEISLWDVSNSKFIMPPSWSSKSIRPLANTPNKVTSDE